MDLNQIVNDTTPCLNAWGFGAMVGAAGYFSVSAARSLGPASNIIDELKDSRNWIVGGLAGAAAAVLGYEYAQGLAQMDPIAFKYVGAAAVGGVLGAGVKPLVSAIASKEALGVNLSKNMKSGFLWGAALLPAAYLTADLVSRYL